MKRNKKKWAIIISVVILLILVGSFFIVGYSTFQIKLKGKSVLTMEVYETYKEKGASAKVFGKKLSVQIKKTVNTKKLGTYKKTYQAQFLFFTKRISRTIKVVDTTAPTLKLKGQEEVSIFVGEDYQDEGVEVVDNYDKDLEKQVKVTSKLEKDKVGVYEILYEVEDKSHNKASITRKVNVKEKPVVERTSTSSNPAGTYIKGILIVNKKYHLPSTYNPGVNPTARSALSQLQSAANQAGFDMPLISGFRSYNTQNTLFNNYVARDGEALANTYSARPGQSEHQTGLAFDIGAIDDNYGDTPAGKWLSENAHHYGFIIRYLKGKENITGYQYEPWHVRYVGTEVATAIYNQGITLEEYLGVA